jgi:ParB family chromosome partitioning protein
MQLVHIPLERLSISAANMRAAKKAPDVSDILPSVRARGVLVPLLVRPNGAPDHFEVVAGRRRFFAATTVAGEGGADAPLPCAILEDGDDAAALEASLIENIARLDPDEVSQWETFARLVKDGRGVEQIAATFGIPDLRVKRILALGDLVPRIRTLYRQQKIDAGTVRHLTLATKAQQRDWLGLYDSPEAHAPRGHQLKQWLFGGQAISTKAALFDLSQYEGPIVADLFGEDSYFADLNAFWSLQRAAVEAKRQSYLDAGWKGVEVLEPGQHFRSWEQVKTSKAKGGKVYIEIAANGQVEAHEGWLSGKEARRQEKDEKPAEKPARPEMTSALRNYVDLHRHAAARAKLLEAPDVALRLMVAHAITGSPLWSVRVEPQRAEKDATAESVETSVSETMFDKARRAVLGLLQFDPEEPTVVGGVRDTSQVFPRLLSLTDAEVLSVLAVAMGETLATGTELIDTLGTQLTLDMSSVWSADDAFFDLLRSRALLTAMVAEVAGDEVAKANAGEKGKALKGIIRDCINGDNGRGPVPTWVPSWLRFTLL